MRHIIFEDQAGNQISVEFVPGQTLLAVAEDNEIHLHSHCEGNGICGGCHVKIDDQSELNQISDLESSGLDMAKGVSMTSRLACQVILSEKCNGLNVKVPILFKK